MCASIIENLQGSGVADNVVSSVVESMEKEMSMKFMQIPMNKEVLSAVPADNLPSRSAVEKVFNNTLTLSFTHCWEKQFVVKLINLLLLLTYTRIYVMENTIEVTCCMKKHFLMLCKFIMMTLKHQMGS